MFACIYVQQLRAEVSGTLAGRPSSTSSALCRWGSRALGSCSLAEFAYSFSPTVEETADDTVVIDVEGCELLFGSAYQLAQHIEKAAAKSPQLGGLGCKVNVALAANPDVAIHAAKLCEGITFTAAGEELITLGGLPVKFIQYSLVGIEEARAKEILETLTLWGVRTFKEFADLPVAGVSERLGQDGLRLQELARGTTSRHLQAQTTSTCFQKRNRT